jgi:primosomal protein N' (replication factor Y) (superfamily II helicase)
MVDVVPAHLDHPFDYVVPEGVDVRVGQRVRVPFAGRRRMGWVVEVDVEPGTEPERILPLAAVDGPTIWFDAEDLRLYRWVADRFAGSLTDVLRHAFPPRVVRIEAEAAAWPRPQAKDERSSDRPLCPSTAWQPYRASRMLRAVHQPAGEAFFWRPLPSDDVARMTADLVARALAAGRSVLFLVPDPSSPLPHVALSLAGPDGVDLRNCSTAERYRAFLRGRAGHLRLVAGERSAALAPLARLGLVIVDDEANPAYKERRSPRHHAREVALARARMAGAACVLIGDLPSAAAWRYRADGHLELIEADRATQREGFARVEVVDRADARPGAHRGRFSARTAQALSGVVAAGGSCVVLATRRGQGAVLVCRGCGRLLACPVCAGSLGAVAGEAARSAAVGEERPERTCSACGWAGPAEPCVACGDRRGTPLAAGAGRLATELARSYPQAEVVRMEDFDAQGPVSRPAIAVMTRGSVVRQPQWLGSQPADLAVIVDADAMLRRGALDAAEDALRLWLAVARWSRHVIIQTREPGHPAVQALVRRDPDGFWEREAERRAELRYPPAGWLLRVTGPDGDGDRIAGELRDHLPAQDEVLGPSQDGAVLVKSAELRGTLSTLASLRHAWGYADRRIRVDVDPL